METPEETPNETEGHKRIAKLPVAEQDILRREEQQDIGREEGRDITQDGPPDPQEQVSHWRTARNARLAQFEERLILERSASEQGQQLTMGGTSRQLLREVLNAERHLDASERRLERHRAWQKIVVAIDAAKLAFDELPTYPKGPKLQAKIAWLELAVNAGSGSKTELRKARDELADL